MAATDRLHVEVLRNCLEGLEETIGRLNAVTTQAPLGALWDQVRDEMSCLDCLSDVLRQAIVAMDGKAG